MVPLVLSLAPGASFFIVGAFPLRSFPFPSHDQAAADPPTPKDVSPVLFLDEQG